MVNISVVVPVKWDVLHRLLVVCELKEFCIPLAAHTKKKAASGTGEADKWARYTRLALTAMKIAATPNGLLRCFRSNS